MIPTIPQKPTKRKVLLLLTILLLLLSACSPGSPQEPAPQGSSKGQLTEETKEYAGLPCIELNLSDTQADTSLIMDRYLELRETGKKEGFVPLIVYEDQHVLTEMLDWNAEKYGSLADGAKVLLQTYPAVDTEAFFADRQRQYEDYGFSFSEEYQEEEADSARLSPDQIADPQPVNSDSQFSLYVPLNTEHIYIAKLPVAADRPYEALAYVPFGGYNDCPSQEEHLAVAKHWFEQYGAIPCAVGYDTLQFYLDQPPTEDRTLKPISEEMFLYCMDIVDQGTGTLSDLKQSLAGNPFWFFWWD